MAGPAMTDGPAGKMGILWRRTPADDEKANAENRWLQFVFDALADLKVAAGPVVYSDNTIEEARDQLLQLDGVLVWVDPIAWGQDRTQLDALLRDVSAKGVWVSAHPDVILKMGTKEVLVQTRDLGWGTDSYLYRTVQQFHEQFPARLASGGPRVLKQHRGNNGIGVWKVELLDAGPAAPGPDGLVRVLEGKRDSLEEDLRLGDFMRRCEVYFEGAGRLIDQPFQERLPDGMVRCYLAQGEVIGFAHQFIRALMPAPAGSDPAMLPQPGPRIMQPASASGFETLRRQMETAWVPGMCRLLDLDAAALPALWDADFLFGPKDASGNDTYVLCEINVSNVLPFPEFAADRIAHAAVAAMLTAKNSRA